MGLTGTAVRLDNHTVACMAAIRGHKKCWHAFAVRGVLPDRITPRMPRDLWVR